jgi:hypothetical protein
MAENTPMDSSAIKIGGKAAQIVKCSQCQKEVQGDQCYTYKGAKGEEVFLCDGCRASRRIRRKLKIPICLALFC